MDLTNYDIEVDSLLDYENPSDVTLKMLIDEIGGISKDLGKHKERYAQSAQWLLDHAKFETFGCAASVYSLQLADVKIAIKAGMIFLCEALTQDTVEKTLHLAPSVYSYMPNLELSENYHEELCPFHGPLKRRKGQWRKDAAPCFCRYGMDFLIMPFCETYVSKSEITPELKAVLMDQANSIFEIGKRFGEYPEVKTIMRLNGQIVFVDFGDVCDMDDLNVLNPRYSDW